MSKFLFLLLFGVGLYSCNTKPTKLPNQTAVQCVGEFMQSIYKGKFDEANTIMQQDSASISCLAKRRFNYMQLLDRKQKLKYKKASVIFDNTSPQSDSVVMFELTDPVNNLKLPTMKVKKKNNEWYVDFAYSCSGNL